MATNISVGDNLVGSDESNDLITKSDVKRFKNFEAKLKTFSASWNKLMQLNGRMDSLIDLSSSQDAVEKTFREYQKVSPVVNRLAVEKAVTGAGAATGSGLIAQEYMEFLLANVAEVEGEVYKRSGVRYLSGVIGSLQVPAATQFAQFTTSTSGTPLTNDLTANNPFLNTTINLAQEHGEIIIWNAPIFESYIGRPAQLMATFEAIMNLKKLQLEDTRLSTAITTNGTGVLESSASTFPLSRTVKETVLSIRRFGTTPKIYANFSGLNKLLDESDLDGNNLNGNNIVFKYKDRETQTMGASGHVGWIAGAEVHLTESVLNTYTVDVTGAITAQTGGTNTAILIGVPHHAAIIRGRKELEFVSVIDGRNDLDAFRSSTTHIVSDFFLGADITNTATWRYIATAI